MTHTPPPPPRTKACRHTYIAIMRPPVTLQRSARRCGWLWWKAAIPHSFFSGLFAPESWLEQCPSVAGEVVFVFIHMYRYIYIPVSRGQMLVGW